MRVLTVIAVGLALAAPAAGQSRRAPPWYKERPLCGSLLWGGTPGVVCRAVVFLLRVPINPFGTENAAAASAASGYASAYGPGLYGNRLGCSGRLWPTTHAVAHRTLPCGTWLRVCYRNRCQRLMVRDRGPYVGGRDMDITEAAVRRFGYSAMGWGVRRVSWTRTS